MGDVRGRFRDELARHPAPPLGDLVEQSVAQGRRLRRRRRLAQFGAGGSALAVLLVIGLAAASLGVGPGDAGPPGGLNLGAQGGSAGTATPSPAQSLGNMPGGFEQGEGEARRGNPHRSVSPTPSTTVIDTVRIGAGPGGKLLTTTPQGGYASLESSGAGPGMPYVQLYLDRGAGPGMVRLSIYQDALGGGPAPGTVELTEVPDNCVQNKIVTVHHREGLQIDLMISTCLAWHGKSNTPARPVLSVDEASEIAASSVWGTQMPAEFVITGEKQFPKLARLRG
jgi:hypothetical protein